MNEWEIAALVLGAALLPCLAVCALAGAQHGLAAFEIGSVLCSSALMVLSEGFHRQPFIDLALILVFMSLVGALVFARLMERDL